MAVAVWDSKKNFGSSPPPGLFDCFLAEYLLSEGRYFVTYEGTLQKYNVTTLEDLAEKQTERLKAFPKLETLYTDIELPLTPILRRMEDHGITVDTTQLIRLGELLQRELGTLTETIYAEVQSPLNLSSPLQVGKMLTETFKVPLSKKSSGSYNTNEQELVRHEEKFPIIRKILKYRELAKLKSTYVEGLMKRIGSDGKIHTTFNQAGAITGRLSSTNPNLQNIPANSDIGKQIKSCFIPMVGHRLVSFDYSQQELRILAHITKEPALVEAFSTDRDIHKVTASRMFKVDYEQVTKEQRSAAKTINFGVLYGMGKYGLSQALGISAEEASSFIQNFFETFSAVRAYYERYLEEARQTNVAETLLGRRRFVFHKPDPKRELDNATRRELTNFPIQGSAADLMKKAMVDIDKELLSSNPDIHLVLQIHDELLFEIPEREPEELAAFVSRVKSIMEESYTLDVPMKAEAKTGQNWGAFEALETNQ